ncbi:hypothetical protein LINGRAHAP2_LOCUS8140 [Linum grandiflorum]
MPLFPFKSNAHFVTSSDGTILQVYELTKPTNQLPFVKKADWKQVTTITASLEEEDDDEKEESYNGLAFFDGHGKIEGEKALTTLAQHLKQLHLLVNPKGYCFQDVSDLGMYSDFGIHYLRLNDLFSWPCHKIDLTTSNVWGRLELKYNSPSKRQGPSPNGGVSKEKYAKLEMLVKEKDEELEKLKRQLKKKDDELRILKKKKDDEDAKTKRIEELEKLNEELEDATKAKSFLPQSADAKEKYLTRRQRIAPEKLVCNALLSFPYVTNSPKLVDNMYNWSSNRVRLVDEESSSSTWPAPPNLDIRIGRGVLDFDRNNWWYVKTTHPEGGLTMLVYYDGNQSQLTLASPSCIVPLPYAKGVEFITYTYRLSLFDLTPLGFRLGFTYRPA